MGKTATGVGIALFVLAGALLVTIPILALGVIGGITGANAQACSTENLSASTTTTGKPKGDSPPPQFVPIYQAAAAKYKLGSKGPSILAAIHGIESAFGTNLDTSSAGANGQMQFMPGTWEAYGVDANGDGKKDLNDPQDAIFSAAHYLRASGAPKDWHGAILAYNHADWYVNNVLSDADKYKIPATGNAAADDNTSDCNTSTTGDFSGNCPAVGLAYIAQPGESGLTKQFGKPGPAGAGKHLKTVSLLGGSVQVHEKIAACVEAVEKERKAVGLNYPIKSGIGAYRYPDGQMGHDSYHEYGAAIDINPETNPYCNGGTVVGNPAYCNNPEMPQELVKIFRKYGFYWGGDYNSLKDWMHFEWHGEKP